MRVRMLQTIAGTLDGVAYPREGVEWEVADAAGALMCAKAQAEPVASPEKPRKAVAKKAEKRA